MLNTFRNIILGATALSASLFSPWANAAELGDFYNLGARPEETAVRVGFIALDAPRYQGSDEQKVTVVPGIFLHASNGLFADPFNGVGYSFDPAGDLNYGVRVNLETGRSVEKTLPGFEKIKARVNPGAFANYAVNDKLTLKSALRLGVGDGADGSLLNLGASYKVYNENYISIALNASVKYANSSYMQSYFGVTPAQSAASGLKTYQPSAGFSMAQVGVTAGFPISRQIYIFSSASVQRLLGDAANSPLTKKQNQFTAFVGSVYSF
jgi:MipA family protein